jgi:hypothetical protein
MCGCRSEAYSRNDPRFPKLEQSTQNLRQFFLETLIVRRHPDEVIDFFFNLPNPSGRTTPWGSLSL